MSGFRVSSKVGGRPPGGPVVLLVDDDADLRLIMREALTEALSAAGVAVRIFELGDGSSAVQFLRRQGRFTDAPLPDLICLDLEMPHLDGLTTAELIKQDPRLRHIPTVILSGVEDETTIRRACALGVNAYAVKPLTAEGLAGAIGRIGRFWAARRWRKRCREAA